MTRKILIYLTLASLIITVIPQVANASSVVGTSTSSSNTLPTTPCRNTFYAAGRHWVLYNNGTSNVFRSSTDGTNWSSDVSTGMDYQRQVSAYFDNTYVHLVSIVPGLSVSIRYRRGLPNSDGTITWSANWQEARSSGIYYFANISVDSGGYAWIVYTSGVDNLKAIKNANNNGTWSTATTQSLDSNNQIANLYCQLVPLTDGKMMFTWNAGSVSDYKLRIRCWTGSSLTGIITTTSQAHNGRPHTFSLSALGDTVDIAFRKNVTYDLIHTRYTYSSHSLSDETIIQSAASSHSNPMLTRRDTASELYCIWGHTDNHIYYRYYNGTSWSSIVDWADESTETLRLVPSKHYIPLTSFYRSYSNMVGIAYVTKSSSPYNVKYKFMSLAVPTVSTNSATNIESTTAILNGSIIATGGVTVDYYAFVWDTTSRSKPSSSTAPSASGYANYWVSSSGNYSPGNYDRNVTGLSQDTPYYVRFAAHNSVGWSYGDEITFTTDGIPVVSTRDATYVTVTTARLQGYLDNMKGDVCQIRWGYGKSNEGDNIEAYDTYTSYEGSYTTGTNLYLDVSNLDSDTTYYFNVQAKNSCGSSTGNVRSFVTISSVGSPSNVIVIPSATSVTLSWVKGAGASNTLIRYEVNNCPTGTTDGMLAYLGTASTYTHTGLMPGTNYCYYIRGYDPAVGYSTNYVITHATTLAAGITPVITNTTISKPTGGMTSTPSVPSELETNIPVFPYIRSASAATGIPIGSFVYILLLFVLTGLSYGIYRWSHSMEAVVIMWIIIAWPAYVIFKIPVLVAIFVTVVGIGYGIYRMRSVI